MKTVNIVCNKCNYKTSAYYTGKQSIIFKMLEPSHIEHTCKPSKDKKPLFDIEKVIADKE